MDKKFLVVDTCKDGYCAHCGQLPLRLDNLAKNAVGEAVFVCDCGGGKEIEFLYPALKQPQPPLGHYMNWIAHFEGLLTNPLGDLRAIRQFGQLIPGKPPQPRPGMTPEQFCYWLQGRAELVAQAPSEAEWAAIVAHLALVFHKVTPPGPVLTPGFPQPDYTPQIIC